MLESIVFVLYSTASAINFATEADAYNLKIRVNPNLIDSTYEITTDPSVPYWYDIESARFKTSIQNSSNKYKTSTNFTTKIKLGAELLSDFESMFLSDRFIDNYFYLKSLTLFESRRNAKILNIMRRIQSPIYNALRFYANVFYIYSDNEVDANGKKVLKFKQVKNFAVDQFTESIEITINSKVDGGLTPKLVRISNTLSI